jgi:AbrB family looped-hinge helix DNA binding protein
MDDKAHVMTVSRNGQVSIPAPARARWQTRRVVVVDLGDRVVVRPMSDNPAESLQGKYRNSGPDSDHVRQQERQQNRVR